jgi:hypothetical protein
MQAIAHAALGMLLLIAGAAAVSAQTAARPGSIGASAPTAARPGATPATAAAPATAAGCQVAQFKGLALGTHDPGERAGRVQAWLQQNTATCSVDQLEAIRGNAASWLGPALSVDITVLIDGALESRGAGSARSLGKLYDPAGKDTPAATTQSVQTGPPRAPVVQPMVNNGLLSGSAPAAPAVVVAPAPVPQPLSAPPSAPSSAPASTGTPGPGSTPAPVPGTRR